MLLKPAIYILTDQIGWHAKQLHHALIHHHCQPYYISLQHLHWHFTPSSTISVHPQEATIPPPAGLFTRMVSAGSFEQITLRLSALHAYEQMNIPVYNSARAIEKTVDKAMTSFLLHHAGIPTPETWVSESTEHLHTLITRAQQQHESVVLKPLFGSQGRAIQRLSPQDSMPDLTPYAGVYYLQKFVHTEKNSDNMYYDWRVFVVNHKTKAIMLRRNTHWLTNYNQGAHCQFVAYDQQLSQLAEAATRAIGLDYAGVDIIRDKTGKAYVLEVNSMPAWRGLQKVCPFSITDALITDFITRRVSPFYKEKNNV